MSSMKKNDQWRGRDRAQAVRDGRSSNREDTQCGLIMTRALSRFQQGNRDRSTRRSKTLSERSGVIIVNTEALSDAHGKDPWRT